MPRKLCKISSSKSEQIFSVVDENVLKDDFASVALVYNLALDFSTN